MKHWCVVPVVLLAVGCSTLPSDFAETMADRSSQLVTEVLSTPVGDDFSGLAYAHSALGLMRIAPEAELAKAAYERAVLTAWMRPSVARPPDDRGDDRGTVRDAIERERQLDTSSLVALRREVIALAKQRRIVSDTSERLYRTYQIKLEPFDAALTEHGLWLGDHPAVAAASKRVRESSCRERGVCWQTGMRGRVLEFFFTTLLPGAGVGLALAAARRRWRKGRGSDADPARGRRLTETLAWASGPVYALTLWVAMSGDLDRSGRWLLAPIVTAYVGLPISVVAVLTVVALRRWSG